jgi:hypothetical protein
VSAWTKVVGNGLDGSEDTCGICICICTGEGEGGGGAGRSWVVASMVKQERKKRRLCDSESGWERGGGERGFYGLLGRVEFCLASGSGFPHPPSEYVGNCVSDLAVSVICLVLDLTTLVLPVHHPTPFPADHLLFGRLSRWLASELYAF